MTVRPITFKVRFLEPIKKGEKTITRRPVIAGMAPYEPGDTLWVRRNYSSKREDADIWLQVVSIEQERLHQMSPEDLEREGLTGGLDEFIAIWDGIYGGTVNAYNTNPLVWRIVFKKTRKPREYTKKKVAQ